MKTSRQLLDKIKNKSKDLEINPQILLRRYFMEQFLARISISKYKNDFILKGGVLISSIVGLNIRTTLDIDISITNNDLNIKRIKEIMEDISLINLDDNIKYEIASINTIRDEFEYPGIRLTFNVYMDKICDFMQIDITTGDVITPSEINYNYKLLLEDKIINLYSYNIETIIAEKIQSILDKSIQNTRMRDFYDVYLIKKLYFSKIDIETLRLAILNTSSKRNSISILNNSIRILSEIENNITINESWNRYIKKSMIKDEIKFKDCIEAIAILLKQTNFLN